MPVDSNPYEISDKVISLLNKKAIKRFREAKRKAAMLDFDELNVIRICKELYQALADDNLQAFTDLAIMVYEDATTEARALKKAKDEAEEEDDWETAEDLWLLRQARFGAMRKPFSASKPAVRQWLNQEILGKPNDITHYTYNNEVDRKRERTAEAINSSTDKKQEFHRGLVYWSQMSTEYADIVTDETTLEAFRDTGVKKVRWVTEQDDRVCKVCGPRDGKVYSIDKVPPQPHWGCRCRLEPVVR